MKKQALVAGLMLTFVLGVPVFSYAGKVELTTYYPAPYGEYTELKATGQTANNSDIALEAKGNTAGTTGLVVTNANRVGIGTTTPAATLQIGGTASVDSRPLHVEGDAAGGIHTAIFINESSRYAVGIGGQSSYGSIQSANADTGAYTPLALNSSGGNVGIGTSDPQYKLDVNGVIRAKDIRQDNGVRIVDRTNDNWFSVNWTGTKLQFYIDSTCVATLNNYATAKNFIISNPVDPKRYLIHTTLEGPENAVFYRGTALLKGGMAEIELPAYFEALTQEEGRTILLTNIGGFDALAVKKQNGKRILNGKFIVMSNHPDSSQEFDWEVKAIRKDVPLLWVEPAKDEIVVKGDGPYKYYFPR